MYNEKGSRIFVLGEIPIQFEGVLSAIIQFSAEHPEAKIFFNIVQREIPAWESKEIQDSVATKLKELQNTRLGEQRVIKKEGALNVYQLNAHPDKIIEDLWKMSNNVEEYGINVEYICRMEGDMFGFDTGSREWDEIIACSNEDNFKEKLGKMMGINNSTGIENQRRPSVEC
jgi:hypothetical protein